jgi:hypothetical protein
LVGDALAEDDSDRVDDALQLAVLLESADDDCDDDSDIDCVRCDRVRDGDLVTVRPGVRLGVGERERVNVGGGVRDAEGVGGGEMDSVVVFAFVGVGGSVRDADGVGGGEIDAERVSGTVLVGGGVTESVAVGNGVRLREADGDVSSVADAPENVWLRDSI